MNLSNNIPGFLVNVPLVKETPSGTKNSSNKVFTLAGQPVYSVDFFVITALGVVSQPAFTFTMPSGVATVTLTTYAPASGDTLVAYSV